MKEDQAVEAIDKSIEMLHEFAVKGGMELYGTLVLVAEDGRSIIHTINMVDDEE